VAISAILLLNSSTKNNHRTASILFYSCPFEHKVEYDSLIDRSGLGRCQVFRGQLTLNFSQGYRRPEECLISFHARGWPASKT